jgi:IS30 family transposase
MGEYEKPGHYEIDNIYNDDKKGGVLTLNHRATMKLYAVIIPDRKATTINRELRKLIKQIGAVNILSITSDNGREFAYSAVIEACYDIKWYLQIRSKTPK